MKKISFVGRIWHIVNILIVMQGILLALPTIFFLNRQYMAAWKNYLNENSSIVIYLRDTSRESKQDIEKYIYEKSAEEDLLIARRDSLLKNDGSFLGYKFGIFGETSYVDTRMTFMGIDVVSSVQIDQLLTSSNRESTLGVDDGSINMLTDISRFRFGEKIVIKKLSQIIAESDTVNGIYIVNGQPEASDKFLSGLEEITGISKDKLLTPMSGEVQDDSFARDILLAFLAAQIILNTVALLVLTMQNLDKQGKLALLGWSKGAFIWGIFEKNFFFTLGCIPALVIAGYFLSGWNRISVTICSFFMLSALINVLLIVLEIMTASIVIVLTRPIDAIRGRIPKQPLYILGIVGYLLLSACLVFGGSYVDQPIQYISENMKLKKQWESVERYEILNTISVGEDSDSFAGRSNQLNQDIYNWYSDIADKDGVYLVNTTYYDDEVLALWKQSHFYQSVPDEPFWYYAVSPNYLEQLGIHVEENILSKAKNGTRIYLFPENMTKKSREEMKGWIEENTTKNLSSADIQTEFTKHPEFDYVDYQAETELFTWSAMSKYSSTVKDPVIYIATPENMRYFETESLRANGFNGYIKFSDRETKELYTAESEFARYNLSDNKIVFSEVKSYIDGLQKELWVTMSWFGIVFLILLFILLGLLLILATIFRVANQEKINVKKFLGFNFWQLYRGPILFLVSVIVLELITMLILHSKFGFLLMLLIFLLQAAIFTKYMSRNELRRVLSAFKGE